MRNISLTSIAILFVLFWSSCTIEKRHYQKGYHVEWKSKKESVKSTDNLAELNKAADESPETLNAVADSTLAVVAIVSDDENAHKSGEDKTETKAPKSTQQRGLNLRRQREFFVGRIGLELPPRYTPKEADQMAQKSLNYGIATWASFAFSILISAAEVAGIIASLAAIGSLIFAILAVVYGNWAKRQMILEPGEYINKRKAIAGLVMGWTYLILLMVAVLLTILLLVLIISMLG